MADVAALGAAHEARLPDRVGREVVVVHVVALVLEREIVDALALLGGAEREQRHHLRLAAREEGRPVRARRDRDLAADRANLLGSATVGTALIDSDLLPDEILVDRLGSAPDGVLRDLVLDRGLALGGSRAGREGQLGLLDDAVEEKLALGRAQLLRILLGVGESAQVGAELLAYRPLDGRQLLLLAKGVEAVAHLQAADDVGLGRLHRQRRRQLGADLLDESGRFAQTGLGDAGAEALGVRLLQLGGQLGVEPLGLTDAAAQLFLRLAEFLDLGLGKREGFEHRLLGHLLGARLDHRQCLLGADHEQVERRALHLLHRAVDNQLALDQADANRAHRPQEGQRRDHQRGRDAVDAKNVVRRHEVGGEHGGDALHLVAETFRPQRPDRPVGHARGQDRPFCRTTFALEETAGDLSSGVHSLLDVHGQREEVGALTSLRSSLRGREHHRVARANDHGAVCLLGELARLKNDFAIADGDRDGFKPSGSDTGHLLLLTFSGEREFE